MLPDWNLVCDNVEGGTACALEKFIYMFEPQNAGEVQEFRAMLEAVLSEARADWDSETCGCSGDPRRYGARPADSAK
ncbi:MAG: hypothetical protein KGL39_07075 [Patescibacteria group bacterium]|nr:hypothetical protein [Patescibacteria group bacterium]